MQIKVTFRNIVLVFCIFLVIFISIYPQILGKDVSAMRHMWISLLFLGICSGLIYGVGFKPKNKILLFIFNPYSAIVLIFGSFYMLFK